MKRSFDQRAILLHARILEDEQQDLEDPKIGQEDEVPQVDASTKPTPELPPQGDDVGKAAVDALASVAQTLAKVKVANDKSQLDAGFGEDLYDQSVLETGDPNGDDVSDATLNNPLGDEMSLEDDEKQVLEAFRKFKKAKLDEKAKGLYKNILEVGSSNRHENWCDYNKGLSCNCGYSSGEIEWPEEYSNEGDIGLSSKEKRDRVARNRRKSGSLKDSKAKSLYKKISEHYLDGASRFDYDSEPSEADEELDSWATRNGHKPDQEIDEKANRLYKKVKEAIFTSESCPECGDPIENFDPATGDSFCLTCGWENNVGQSEFEDYANQSINHVNDSTLFEKAKKLYDRIK